MAGQPLLDAKVRDALRAHVAATGQEGFDLRQVEMRFPFTGLEGFPEVAARFANDPSVRAPTGYRWLRLVFSCHPLLGPEAAKARVSGFVESLRRTHPEFGRDHEWSIEIELIEDTEALECRKEKVRAFVEAFLERFNGVYLNDEIKVVPVWAPIPVLRAVVYRDDIDGDDEAEVAYELSGALAEWDPDLAQSVEVDSSYK